MLNRKASQYIVDDVDRQWWLPRRRAYKTYGPFRIVSTLMIAIGVGLIAFGLACAVMFVADIAEEHPSGARRALRMLIAFNLVVHTSIFLIDQLSWWRSVLSVVVNILYLRLLRTFPFLPNFNSPLVIGTVMAVVLESAMWYWYSVRLMYYTSLLSISGFFLLLWLVPIGLLSSCVLEDDRLPGVGNAYGGGAADLPGAGVAGDRRKRTILNRLADLVIKS